MDPVEVPASDDGLHRSNEAGSHCAGVGITVDDVKWEQHTGGNSYRIGKIIFSGGDMIQINADRKPLSDTGIMVKISCNISIPSCKLQNNA